MPICNANTFDNKKFIDSVAWRLTMRVVHHPYICRRLTYDQRTYFIYHGWAMNIVCALSTISFAKLGRDCSLSEPHA